MLAHRLRWCPTLKYDIGSKFRATPIQYGICTKITVHQTQCWAIISSRQTSEKNIKGELD